MPDCTHIYKLAVFAECHDALIFRISARMETVGNTVGTKTKSLFQSIKDRTEQLTNKKQELQPPDDVAPSAYKSNVSR